MLLIKNKIKCKSDYILNIERINKNKIGRDFNIMNKHQSFILNYELHKLLNKVITIDNSKYSDMYYNNNNLSISGVLNLIHWLNKTYKNHANFTYYVHLDDAEDNVNFYNILKKHYNNIIKKEVN